MIELSAGQGSALSGFFTGVGAIVAVFLAQHIFKGRISDLKSAVGETEGLVKSFKASVDAQLNEVKDKFSELNAVTSAIQEGLSKTQAAVLERTDEQDQGAPQNVGIAVEADDRSRLKKAWHQIVDHIEAIAGSPNVDGRTRAKYGRIDRRSYYDLINALDAMVDWPDIRRMQIKQP